MNNKRGEQGENSESVCHMVKNVVDVLRIRKDMPYKNKCKVIAEAMDAMMMRKQEKGTTAGTQKNNTLLGRWFSVAKK